MYNPWGDWPNRQHGHCSGCACSFCRPVTTSTSSTFTFRQHEDCESWVEAVKFAMHLRMTGQCHTKPRVSRRTDDIVRGEGRWQVSWIPAHYVSWNTA